MKSIFTLRHLACITLVALQITLHAQPTKNRIRLHDLTMNTYVSGNSFGWQHNPSIGIMFGKRILLSTGPLFNAAGWKSSGYLFSTRYYFVKEDESNSGHFMLSAALTCERLFQQRLSGGAIEREKLAANSMRNDESAKFEELDFQGWEYAVGLGCTYHFDFGMLLRAEAGVAYFSTKQLNHPEINSFRDEKGTSLRLGFGIGWILSKPNATRPNAQAMSIGQG